MNNVSARINLVDNSPLNGVPRDEFNFYNSDVSFRLFDSTAQEFNSEALPTSVHDVDSFTSNYLSIRNLDPNSQTYSVTSFTTPEAVPVPAAAWLFGSGLLSLVGVSHRKAQA